MNPTASSISEAILERNQTYIPGGVFSLNRAITPMRVFKKAKGAYLWDVDGNRYIDYHAAFGPMFLGHGDPDVDEAVIATIRSGASLFGAGTTELEGEFAELMVNCVPTLEQIQVTNTGSEATSFAIRLARAITGRDGIIIMQGGYNGWQDDVAFNLMDPLETLSGQTFDDELTPSPITAGIPKSLAKNIHPVQFNNLAAIEAVLKRGNIAAVLTEPILQNIGVVKPKPGYLQGLRKLCDTYDALLILDEIKTGFRHALGGYQSIAGVTPDLSTFGKAIANGYPLGVIGGKQVYMQYFNHPEVKRKVLIAGTYNGHPVPLSAGIATLKKLRDHRDEIYGHTDRLGARMEEGLRQAFKDAGIHATIARQGSAFVAYFMDHEPQNWLDLATNHDMEFDRSYRDQLIKHGVFHFPTPTKQGSISYAHTAADIDETLEMTTQLLRELE